MQTKWKVLIVTLVVAVPAFMLGSGSPLGEQMWQAIWPFEAPGEGLEPSSSQLPFFMFLGVVEAVAMGLAVAYLAFGRNATKELVGGGARGGWTVVAVTWLLGNWWVHDNLHIVNGENMGGLLAIEYMFHVTLIIAGAFLAFIAGTSLRGARRPAASTA